MLKMFLKLSFLCLLLWCGSQGKSYSAEKEDCHREEETQTGDWMFLFETLQGCTVGKVQIYHSVSDFSAK